MSSIDAYDSGRGVADRVELVSGVCRPLYVVDVVAVNDDVDGVGVAGLALWTVERSGARIPDRSEIFVSDGVGVCCARHASVSAWKSNL